MIGLFERWPATIRKHYMKHHQTGLQAIANKPCATQSDRAKRMLEMERLRRQILRHMVKVHPQIFS